MDSNSMNNWVIYDESPVIYSYMIITQSYMMDYNWVIYDNLLD